MRVRNQFAQSELGGLWPMVLKKSASRLNRLGHSPDDARRRLPSGSEGVSDDYHPGHLPGPVSCG